MKLGVYKIRKDGSIGYLRYFQKYNRRFIQRDHGMPIEIKGSTQEFLEDYEIIKEQRDSVQASNLKIVVSFTDQDGDEIVLNARNIQAFENIFKKFPSIATVIGLKKSI